MLHIVLRMIFTKKKYHVLMPSMVTWQRSRVSKHSLHKDNNSYEFWGFVLNCDIEKIGGVTVLFKSWNLNTILLLGLTLVSKRLIAAYKKFITLTDIGLKRNTDKPIISQNVLHIVLRVIFTKKSSSDAIYGYLATISYNH